MLKKCFPVRLTIEKIEPQQRVPIVLDATNQAVLQQAINNGQLVVQSKVATTETTPLQGRVLCFNLLNLCSPILVYTNIVNNNLYKINDF